VSERAPNGHGDVEERSATLSRRHFTRRVGALSAGVTVAGLVPSAAAEVRAQQGKHPNVALIEEYYAADGGNDLDAMRNRFFASDIVWRIPGHHPLAGVKRGVDEVVAFFGQFARARFRAETVFLEANDEWVVDLHRGWSEAGPGIDMMWALAFRVRDGTIVKAVNYPGDQHAADRFFWAMYPLKPIPDRLA
jgi:uncharacterized protein